MIAGSQYEIRSSTHDLVKIDKYLAETVAQMDQQLHSFSVFLQTKKGWNTYSHGQGAQAAGTSVQMEALLKQYNQEEGIFEEAHNNMVNRLNNYRSLPSREKIHQSAQYLQDFSKSYNLAYNAKSKLEELNERIVLLQTKPQTAGALKDSLHGDGRLQSDLALSKSISLGASNSGFKPPSSLADLQSKESVYSSSFPQNSQSSLLKKNPERRKHFALSISIQMPDSDVTFNIATNTSVKVKQLKELILQKISFPALVGVSVEQMQLQIQGGDYLKKNSALLDDAGVKERSHLIVSVLDKSAVKSAGAGSAALERRRSTKDETKVPIIYTLRNA